MDYLYRDDISAKVVENVILQHVKLNITLYLLQRGELVVDFYQRYEDLLEHKVVYVAPIVIYVLVNLDLLPVCIFVPRP